MSNIKLIKFSKYALTACGILSGITFTALVLIMQQADAFAPSIPIQMISDHYVQILIGGMAGICAAFIFCTIALVRPAAGLGLYSENKLNDTDLDSNRSYYYNMTIYLYGIGCYGLVVMLPMLVLPISWLAALIIFLLEVTTIGSLTIFDEKNRPIVSFIMIYQLFIEVKYTDYTHS